MILGYHVVHFDRWGSSRRHDVVGAEIELRWPPTPCASQGVPEGDRRPPLMIDYRHDAEATARAILKIVQALRPRQRIIFGPPYY